jgi:glutaminyl-peptide cyclotransferase
VGQSTPKFRRGFWIGLPLLLVGLAGGLILFEWGRDREANAAVLEPPVKVDGARAYKYLKQLVAIGPRPAGSEANAKQRALVAAHFKTLGGKVTEQAFYGADPKTRARVNMANLIGAWHPDRRERIVIGAHYDTRPFPDEEEDPARRLLPFVGANDGASGVALLMELAHHLEKLPTEWGVDLVLFDGEELVYGGGQNQNGEYFLGSKEFAAQYANGTETRQLPYRYAAGFVLDMVGDKNLNIKQEQNSLSLARGLLREVWTVARQVKATGFKNEVGQAVNDDHLPLNDARIPTIDLIDFDYPYWHTSQDLPEHCSAASLEQVGRVLTAWLAQPRKRAK